MARGRGRSWLRVAGDIALTGAAVLGTICIVLVLAAAFFDARIILFSTGSMSPTIPAGSAAVVRQIPAAEIDVGDVITVDRPGRLPITHRVTGVTAVPGASDDARRITMRGDANPVDDALPYDVSSVRRVMFSVPGIAPVFAAFGNPWVLGTLTVAATALVIGVFWPKRGRRAEHSRPRRAPAAPAGHEDPQADNDDHPRRVRMRSGVVGSLAVLLTAASVLTPPVPARAAADERIIQGEVIRLVSIEPRRMSDIAPGTSAAWLVGVSADAPSPGTVDVEVSATGDAALDLRYEIRSCEVRWVDGACAEAATLVAEQTIPLDGAARGILSMAADQTRWLRILVTRPPQSDAALSGAVDIVVRAVGAGDDISTGPVGPLPATGAGVPWALSGLAVMLLALGAGAMRRGRRAS